MKRGNEQNPANEKYIGGSSILTRKQCMSSRWFGNEKSAINNGRN